MLINIVTIVSSIKKKKEKNKEEEKEDKAQSYPQLTTEEQCKHHAHDRDT
jgi:hypothetical protein